MPRAKVKRQSTSVDMTAMCDVTFLLLNFFVMTSVTKVPDPVDITVPSSTYKIKLPEKDMTVLTLGGKEQVFFETLGPDVMAATLDKMADQYNLTFTPLERKRFSIMGSFGVPIQNLKQYINLDGAKRRSSGLGTGIPTDSLDNQLSSWILNSRKSVAELHSVAMRVSIKGDKKQGYPAIKKVVDILQKQKINKFSLVTLSEGG